MKKLLTVLLIAVVLSGSAWFAFLKPSESAPSYTCHMSVMHVEANGLYYAFPGERIRCPSNDPYR